MENLENKLSQKGYWSEEQTLPVVGDTYYQKKVVEAWDFIEIDEPIQIRKDLMIQNIEQGKLFWNLNVALIFLADRLNPRSYLEVGVRTCGSLVPVLHNSNVKEVVGVDVWAGSYSGFPNTLEYAIRQIVKYKEKANKQFEVKFIKGDSHRELKGLIRDGKKFDLITVDGDHSEAGAWEDLEDAAELLNDQGAIVFDDIIHPDLPHLKDVAAKFQRKYPYFIVLTNSRQDNGCAVFLKNIDAGKLLNEKFSEDSDRKVKGVKVTRCWCNGQLKDSVHPLYGQCRNCGTLVLKEQPTKEQLEQFYTFDGYWHDEQVNVSGYPPIERRAADDFADRIPVWHQLLQKYKPQLGSLLEIGCAHGGFLHYCREHGVKNVIGVEPDERTCEFARKHFDLPYVVSGLFPDVSLPFEKFDAVVGFDVIEHFRDPLRAVQRVADLINENGICLFQVPCYRGEGRQWVQFRPNEHIFLYNSQSIRQLFDCAGLEVTEELAGYFPDDMFVAGRKKTVRNLLFVRTDSIGDNVLAASMLPYIREKYKDAKITVLCQDHIAELYESCPCVDDIVVFNRKKAYEDAGYRNEIINRLRALKPELSLNTVFSREPLTDVFAVESGAGTRIAFEGNLSNISAELRHRNNQFYTRLLPDDGKRNLELDRHRDFLRGLGIDVPSLKPMVWTTDEDENFAEEFFEKNGLEPKSTVALFAGAQRQVRLYDKYGEVLSEFCKKNRLKVVALGSDGERDCNQGNLDTIGVETINLSGRTTIRQSAAILRRCRLAVGAETGLAHISCAVGTPNIILLGGGHFGRFMPYSELTSVVCLPLDCFGCDWKCGYKRPHCVKDIATQVFAEAVWQTFQRPSERMRVFVQAASLWNPESGQPKWRMFEKLPAAGNVEIITVGEKTGGSLSNAPQNQYLVTAIVSTYNSEQFFRGCLEDLENQTIADRLEIIVVNSGSKQNEEKIVQEFQKKFDNIKYIKTEQREGVYAAWNRAVKVAQGEFLTNANTDDRHSKDALEIMAKTLLANPDIALVYGDQIVTKIPNDNFYGHKGTDFARQPEYSRDRLLFGCCVGSQPMWRRRLHDEFGYFDETLTCAGDWDFWLRVADKNKFRHIPEFLGLYYRNEDGVEHGRKIHSLYERYLVGKRYGNPYISVIELYQSTTKTADLRHKDNPLVSVIMPAYNAANYIGSAIESVLIANYRNFELIVVDDGSTDNTKEAVAGFKDDKIRYFHKENGGPASARNVGIKNAAGSFVVFLDADDMIVPNFISSHLAEFEKNPDAELVYCDDCLMDEGERPLRVIKRPEYTERKFLVRDLFRCGFPVVPFRGCIRKSVFEKIGLYEESLLVAEDFDMVRRAVKSGLKMRHLSAPLYLRRMTAGGLSRTFTVDKLKFHFKVLKRFTDTFGYDELFPDVKWDGIEPANRRLHGRTLVALTYLTIGQSYADNNCPAFALTARQMACYELKQCLAEDARSERLHQMLQRCELVLRKSAALQSQPAYQTT